MSRRVIGVVAAVLLAAGCGASSGGSGFPPPRDAVGATSTPTPAPPGMQQAWLRGVGVDAPAGWKSNNIPCGTPVTDTLVLEYTGTGMTACLRTPVPDLSVIWMGTFTRPVPDRATLGEAMVRSDSDIDRYDDATIDGHPVKETTQQTRDGRTLRLVLFLDRDVYVTAASPDPAVVHTAVDSLQVRDNDPVTGCVVQSHAYDDGKPPAGENGDSLLPGQPTSADGCVYVDGWLERTAHITGANLTTLVDAVRAAPPTTTAKAPDDRNCESVADLVTPADNPPMALFFHDAAGGTWTVVAKINPCTRWQSTISSGGVTRRIDQRLLLALPQLWTSYPDPDSMDGP